MAKLSLRQIDSLIEDNEITEDELKAFLKEGYDPKDIETYFLKKLQESKEEDTNLGDNDDYDERQELEY